MPLSDPLDLLLTHDRWATHQVLDACDKLTPDQFHRRFDIGPGSLHDTLTHIISVVRTWTDTLAGQDPRPRPDADGLRRTVADLRTLHDESCHELAAETHRLPLATTTTRRLRTGPTITLTRAAILTHIPTHSMHHRAQCLNMLRHLGINPVPPTSIVEWTFLADPGA